MTQLEMFSVALEMVLLGAARTLAAIPLWPIVRSPFCAFLSLYAKNIPRSLVGRGGRYVTTRVMQWDLLPSHFPGLLCSADCAEFRHSHRLFHGTVVLTVWIRCREQTNLTLLLSRLSLLAAFHALWTLHVLFLGHATGCRTLRRHAVLLRQLGSVREHERTDHEKLQHWDLRWMQERRETSRRPR